MRRTQTSLRVWLLVALTVPALVAPQGVSSQAGTRAGVSTQRSSSGEDVQSSEARGTRGTRETDARGSRLGADEYAEEMCIRDRPLRGVYSLRIPGRPEIDFTRMDGIQPLLSYRYWTRQN